MSKTLKNKDFVELLKIFNEYFDLHLPNKNQLKKMEDVTFVREGLKKIYVPYVDSNNEKETFELWINESIHYDTEYVLFYYEENEDKLNHLAKNKNRKTYFFKNLSEDLNKEATQAYELLSNLRIIKIKNF